MSVVSKLGLLAAVAAAGLIVFELDLVGRGSNDLTEAALQQFQNSDAAAETLRRADASKTWWLLAWPAGVALLAGLLFWEDLERLWKREPGARAEDNGRA
jgi:hypothetical protein